MENNLKDQHYKNMGITLQMDTLAFEAESVAYTVCQHFGIDTSEYSFGYIAGWSSGKETSEMKESLGKIRTAASGMITEIEGRLAEMEKAPQLDALSEITAGSEQAAKAETAEDSRSSGHSGKSGGHEQKASEKPSVLQELSARKGDAPQKPARCKKSKDRAEKPVKGIRKSKMRAAETR